MHNFKHSITSAVACLILALFIGFFYHSPKDPRDWNDRATLYARKFTPSAENLVFAVTECSMMDPNGFTFALFLSPYPTTFNPIPCIVSECKLRPLRIAVDAFGLVWQVSERDFHALRALSESTRPFAMRNWPIRVSYTCTPSHSIILPIDNRNVGFTHLGVSAYSPGLKKLEQLTTLDDGTEYTDLPKEIDKLLQIMLGRRGRIFGPGMSEEDKDIVRAVQQILRGPVVSGAN